MAQKKKRTLREQRSEETSGRKPRRFKAATGKISRPLRRAASHSKREFHPVKLPDNRAGRILGKRVNLVPKFFREAWSEITQVTWPTGREMVRLTIAVFIFSVILTAIVAVLDLGLDKLFREIIVQ